MPILDVECVCAEGERLPDRLAATLAEDAGRAIGAAPGHTWVRLRALPSGHYAESGGGPGALVRPVFVELLMAALPEPAERAALAKRLCGAVAEACGRPVDNVHLLFLPAARGRVAFGGQLRE